MKIAMVFDGLQFGGIERVGVEYIKLLSGRNYEITVVNLRPNLNAMEKEIPVDVRILQISESASYGRDCILYLCNSGKCSSKDL